SGGDTAFLNEFDFPMVDFVNGAITHWYIVTSVSPSFVISRFATYDLNNFCYILCNHSSDYIIDFFGNQSMVSDNPGTWSLQTSATPLPSALLLFFTGIVIVGLLGRRRTQKVAALAAA